MELAVNELPTPLFVRPIGKMPTFKIAEGARLIAKSDAEVERAYNQIKGAAQRQLIHPRQRPNAGKTSPAEFGLDDLAVMAGVLGPLYDFGMTDAELSGYASRAAYGWDRSCNPRPSYIPNRCSPILAALLGINGGQFWLFKLATYYCDQTGLRRVSAAIYDADAPPRDVSSFLPPSFLPGEAFTTALPTRLLPLTRVMGKRARLDA